MAPEKHAILSASAAHRWMNCPPSALLCAAIPDEPSPYAEEGTKAHALCEELLRRAVQGQEAETRRSVLLSPCGDNENRSRVSDGEMLEAARGYRDYVLGETDAAYELFIEQRVDYSRWAQDGFGTVDCLAVTNGVMKVFDFKYGQGVEVDAEWNPQLLCYALGGQDFIGRLYAIHFIELHIYQPRREHISVFRLSIDELLYWAETKLKPAAELAWNGRGDTNPGEWCRFCKGKATCKALAERNLELAKLDFPEPIGMSTAEVAQVLPKLDLLIEWANAVKEHALFRATKGEKFPGYKLVAGRSARRFSSETEACLRIKEAGFNPYITKMKGLTELQKEMGRKNFESVCGELLVKPAGKPALVPETDKRQAIDLSAAADFSE